MAKVGYFLLYLQWKKVSTYIKLNKSSLSRLLYCNGYVKSERNDTKSNSEWRKLITIIIYYKNILTR